MVGVSDRIDGWWNHSVSIERDSSKGRATWCKSNTKTNGNTFLIREKRGAKASLPMLTGIVSPADCQTRS
jgi:hypothetical protein